MPNVFLNKQFDKRARARLVGARGGMKLRCGPDRRTAACGAYVQQRSNKKISIASSRGKARKNGGIIGTTSSTATGRVLRERRAKLPSTPSGRKRLQKAACGAHGRLTHSRHVVGNTGQQKQRKLHSALPHSKRLTTEDKGRSAGQAQETDYQHSRRHLPQDLRRWASTCPRCAYLTWMRKGGPNPAWLCTKPSFMQGSWGLGCTYCAAGRVSREVERRRRGVMVWNRNNGFSKQAVPRAAKWSRYEVTHILTARSFAWHLQQHEGTDGHRQAMEVFHGAAFHLTASSGGCTDVCALRLPNEATKTSGAAMAKTSRESSVAVGETIEAVAVNPAVDLFRGRVPQVKNWLDVWADSASAVSSEG
jgi:hypothetical protein